MDIEQLIEELRSAKEVERDAAAKRVEAEAAVIAALGEKDEGSKTHTVGAYKVTITGKVSRRMDWAKWEEAKQFIPDHLHPVKMVPELDERGVKWLYENNQEVYKLLPLTVKKAKTAVDIKAKD